MNLQIWIPHLKKMAVKDLPPGHDPSDPPLTPESLKEAKRLSVTLEKKYGAPSLILHSPKLRCFQTAEPAILKFGQFHKGGCPVISLNSLCQPDSGDHDPLNPKADKDGHVIYGDHATKEQWYHWFVQSRNFLNIYLENYRFINGGLKEREGTIWVFTHRPICAAAHKHTEWDHDQGNYEELDPFNPSLLPYSLFYFNEDSQFLKYTP